MASTAGSLSRPRIRSAANRSRAASTCILVTLTFLTSFCCFVLAIVRRASSAAAAPRARVPDVVQDLHLFDDLDRQVLVLGSAYLRHSVTQFELGHLVEQVDDAGIRVPHRRQAHQEPPSVLARLRIVTAAQLRRPVDPVPVLVLPVALERGVRLPAGLGELSVLLPQLAELDLPVVPVPPAVAEPATGQGEQRDQYLRPQLHVRTVTGPVL